MLRRRKDNKDMRPLDEQTSKKPASRPWQRPSLKPVGTVAEVLEGGGGKHSPMTADPGDNRKPSGQN